MKSVLIIVGSHKVESNSAKVAAWIKDQISETSADTVVNVYDLGKTPLPVWDERIWQKDKTWQEKLHPLRTFASQADALICVVPEIFRHGGTGFQKFNADVI